MPWILKAYLFKQPKPLLHKPYSPELTPNNTCSLRAGDFTDYHPNGNYSRNQW